VGARISHMGVELNWLKRKATKYQHRQGGHKVRNSNWSPGKKHLSPKMNNDLLHFDKMLVKGPTKVWNDSIKKRN